MNLLDLKNLLKQTGYPVAYYQFGESVSPPFIAFVELDSNNLFADDAVYKEMNNVQIELYTAEKDLEAENRVKELLTTNQLLYETDNDYIPSQKLFRKIFEVRLI